MPLDNNSLLQAGALLFKSLKCPHDYSMGTWMFLVPLVTLRK